MIRHQRGDYRWEDVEVHPYKEEGTHFKSITRQTLLKEENDLSVELRYFEVAADGHSTLERHEHSHVVMVIRGSGEVLVKDKVAQIRIRDIVHVPPMTWHQFRAVNGEELGFLCVVRNDRDRPQRPLPSDLEQLRSDQRVAEFIRT
jgi:quercetin dioxygenase-like cupin family protein